jgi:hypothetical protein
MKIFTVLSTDHWIHKFSNRILFFCNLIQEILVWPKRRGTYFCFVSIPYPPCPRLSGLFFKYSQHCKYFHFIYLSIPLFHLFIFFYLFCLSFSSLFFFYLLSGLFFKYSVQPGPYIMPVLSPPLIILCFPEHILL